MIIIIYVDNFNTYDFILHSHNTDLYIYYIFKNYNTLFDIYI